MAQTGPVAYSHPVYGVFFVRMDLAFKPIFSSQRRFLLERYSPGAASQAIEYSGLKNSVQYPDPKYSAQGRHIDPQVLAHQHHVHVFIAPSRQKGPGATQISVQLKFFTQTHV